MWVMFTSLLLEGTELEIHHLGDARVWEDVHVCEAANRSQPLLQKERREL